MHSLIEERLFHLKNYCEREHFKGWDPYDGLNAKALKYLPFRNNSLFRIFWIQLFRRSPLNLRRISQVLPDYNPKGLALFLSGYIRLYKKFKKQCDKEKIIFIKNKLLKLQSKNYKEACWGYNFPWQSRAFFFPEFTPNIVVSTFVGEAFLDLYELWGDNFFLNIARSICDFILKRLNRTYKGDDSFCFSYSPLDNSCIFNASLLASKFLARVYYFSKDSKLLSEAKKSLEFCKAYQNRDGSWFYGRAPNQKWIDSFHTAYNLEAIYKYQNYTSDYGYEENFRKGVDFYLKHFFTKEGIPKYYPNKVYPVDIHSAAQFLVFLKTTNLLDKHYHTFAKVLKWVLNNMQDKEGYFYYQFRKFYKIKIPYLRWSCAWMFYALSNLI